MIREMKDHEINHEIGIHGRQWDHAHGGYFSDPTVAAVLIEEVRKAIALEKPQVVADLGGGTGYLLEELAKNFPDESLELVNVDLSDRQLEVRRPRITPLLCSVSKVKRGEIGEEEKRFLFLMRSVLHYFGREGLLPILKHIRSQMKPGEFFIHQTACSESEKECRCLNALYKEMATNKWYPLTGELSGLLEKTGWQVKSAGPCPSLPVTSEELENRYNFTHRQTLQIREKLIGQFGQIEDIFVPTPTGFRACLRYRIYTCRAK